MERMEKTFWASRNWKNKSQAPIVKTTTASPRPNLSPASTRRDRTQEPRSEEDAGENADAAQKTVSINDNIITSRHIRVIDEIIYFIQDPKTLSAQHNNYFTASPGQNGARTISNKAQQPTASSVASAKIEASPKENSIKYVSQRKFIVPNKAVASKKIRPNLRNL